MKALAVLSIFVLISLESSVFGHDHRSEPDHLQDPIIMKHFAKITNHNKNVKLVNLRRLFKPKVMPMKTKKPEPKNEGYTVFPPVPASKSDHNPPDSPYFPLEEMFGQKPRVKKVLPDADYKPREKRAAGTKNYDHKVSVQAKEATRTHRVKGLSAFTSKNAKVTKENKVGKRQKSAKRQRNKSKGKSNKRSSNRAKTSKPSKEISGKRYTDKNAKKHQKAKASRRLTAARDADSDDYPYVISIQKNGEHWCGGALLNRRLIITTANCLWKSTSISHLTVRVGTRYLDRGGQVAYIQEVMKHPGWDIRGNPDKDLALAVLDRNIRFSHGVHGVDLPNRIMSPPFEDAWVTSWGAERRDGVYESRGMTLQVYHAHVMERDQCNNITQRFGVSVSNNFICLEQVGKRAPCTRDTGAPAVSDGILWGLASWGIRKLCGTERFPAMFSYTASHDNIDFIMNATRYLMSDIRLDPFPDRHVMPAPTTTTVPPPLVPNV